MTHIFWSWKIKRYVLESKGRPEERTSKIMLHDFVLCLAERKSPHQTEPSQHLYKHSALGLQKARSTLPLLLLQFSSFILPIFPFSSFLQAQPPADWCNSLSFIFYFIISFCDFTSLATPGVFFLSQPILLKGMKWEKVFLYHISLSFLHHSIHCLTSIWMKWFINFSE